MADLAAFQDNTGITFRAQSLLVTALTHSSFVNENPGATVQSNERLEFLGDAVLGIVVAEKLYQEFPGLGEGPMTRLRSMLVRRDTLARVAQTVNLGDFLYLGKGEEASGGRHKTANLAGALEAVIAAIYLDQGMSAAGDFIRKLLAIELERARVDASIVDFKSRLQEMAQSRYQAAPTYSIVEETGPDHDKLFTVEVMVGGGVMGRGSGKSKKAAESEAARLALERLSSIFTG